jgi:hypothetical protein
MKETVIKGVAMVLGVMFIANGIYQLVAPESWYWAIPGVPDRGPFNQHFVRDIGIIYTLCGVGSILGALKPVQRMAYWWAPIAWLAGHAVFHIWEVIVGICGPESLLEDFAGVTLPALLLLALLLWSRNEQQTA